MLVVIRASDDPEANGRKPKPGDQRWKVTFPHENGDDYVEIRMGNRGFTALRRMIRQSDCDDWAEMDPACLI